MREFLEAFRAAGMRVGLYYSLAGLETRVRRAVLLATGRELPFEQDVDSVTVRDLLAEPPTDLFPVIRLGCEGPPAARPWSVDRLWQGDPRRMTTWAAARGASMYADGRPR